MADTEVNVLNRPTVLATAWGALIQGWPILAAAVTFGLWLVHLEGKTDTNGTDNVSIRTSITERNARWAADQKAQNERVDRIEENRTQNLQRLATVEEAIKGQRDILQDIRAKLDRALMGRLAQQYADLRVRQVVQVLEERMGHATPHDR